MEQWPVQLITLLGVTIGALASFVTTRLVDRSRWQREEALRWDTKRLESYGEFASALREFITIGYRITAGLGLPASAQPLDTTTGLPALATTGGEVSVKWEQVLMLGAPAVITAAHEWRNGAICLEKFALGLRKDAAEYAEAIQDLSGPDTLLPSCACRPWHHQRRDSRWHSDTGHDRRRRSRHRTDTEPATF